ncbi:hypothetical protein L3X39_13260 [Sabulilitoribacter multivorans]|uniref:DNA replication protein DnaC n=1 Tax=Flaviramulus multivorans TaxID=1304750 RepID=A0ABS9ILX9_9FLAO|nr:hypothetical protein [Flaviramulus multivorans]MCF7561609.1 hypothetical protein [Flaviramulus multivorans]
MFRDGKTEKISQVINAVVNDHNNCQRIVAKPCLPISKQDLWLRFLETFKSLTGKRLINDKQTKSNLKVLFYYFLRDDDFFTCKNLHADISKPSFDKGLLIIGATGVGKTDYLKVFEKIFIEFHQYRFKGENSNDLVTQYETCATPSDKELFFRRHQRKRLFIDDINSESIASNYGKYDVVGNILMSRHEKKLITYVTTNYLTDEKSLTHTLEALGHRYGFRLYDRLFEMFNFIEFHGKSYR